MEEGYTIKYQDGELTSSLNVPLDAEWGGDPDGWFEVRNGDTILLWIPSARLISVRRFDRREFVKQFGGQPKALAL